MFVSDALIRAYLHLDPTELTDQEWAHQLMMAEYIKLDLANTINGNQ